MASFEHEMNVHPCSITDANAMYFPASSITAFANLAVYVEHSLDICPTVSASRSVPGLLSRPCACSNSGGGFLGGSGNSLTSFVRAHAALERPHKTRAEVSENQIVQ